MSPANNPTIEFEKVIGKTGLFCDGDWIESKDQDQKGQVRLIQLADIGDGVFLNKSSRFLTQETATKLKCTYLHPGDVLVARMPDPLGRSCIFPGDEKKCVAAVDICIVRVDPTFVDNEWLIYAINNDVFRNQINKFVAGATRQRISRKNLEKIKICVPALADQKRIAAYLNKANDIRKKRLEAVRLTEELLRAVFLDTFGDPIENNKGWNRGRLEDFLSFLTSGSRGWAKHYSKAGTKFLRIQNVGKNRLLLDDVAFVTPQFGAEAERTKVKEGDVLLSITADLGRTAVIPKNFGEAHINQHLAILRVRGIRPLYLSAYLASEGGQAQIKRLNKEGVKAGLNFDDIRSIAVLVPPEKKQRDFENIYYNIIDLLQKEKSELSESDNLYNSILQKSFDLKGLF